MYSTSLRAEPAVETVLTRHRPLVLNELSLGWVFREVFWEWEFWELAELLWKVKFKSVIGALLPQGGYAFSSFKDYKRCNVERRSHHDRQDETSSPSLLRSTIARMKIKISTFEKMRLPWRLCINNNLENVLEQQQLVMTHSPTSSK
uniref:Uncharacterized protein n=1 Tax=Cucumis sativus TaxID=3659 RepID=A0A0A0K9B0_CUCSA